MTAIAGVLAAWLSLLPVAMLHAMRAINTVTVAENDQTPPPARTPRGRRRTSRCRGSVPSAYRKSRTPSHQQHRAGRRGVGTWPQGWSP